MSTLPEVQEMDFDEYDNWDQEELDYEKEIEVINEFREFVQQRRIWSKVLLIVLVVLVIFSIIFTFLIGLQILVFDSEAVLATIYGSFVLQIIGLALVVVQFLFKEPPRIRS